MEFPLKSTTVQKKIVLYCPLRSPTSPWAQQQSTHIHTKPPLFEIGHLGFPQKSPPPPSPQKRKRCTKCFFVGVVFFLFFGQWHTIIRIVGTQPHIQFSLSFFNTTLQHNISLYRETKKHIVCFLCQTNKKILAIFSPLATPSNSGKEGSLITSLRNRYTMYDDHKKKPHGARENDCLVFISKKKHIHTRD